MFKVISHITLSILILSLSIGINISKHYSNGKLYSYSIIGDTESCITSEKDMCPISNKSEKCEVHNNEDKNNSQNPCSCEDTSEYMHFDADYTVTKKLKINNIYKKQITLFANILFFNYSILSDRQIQNSDTKNSVLKIQDFASLFQVFRC